MSMMSAGAAGYAGQQQSPGAVYVPANDGEMELRVNQAQLVKSSTSDYHTYPIEGRDSLGEI